MPGSETRNPFIAAVFHDTNLAETKGSGIRAMRRLMQASHLAPPTFESNRTSNEFTARLLLHHFLGEEDIKWLRQFSGFDLSDAQKQALLFVREVDAIDNQTYRQMADCDMLKASIDLRILKSFNLLRSKGKGKRTYYVAASGLSTPPHENSTPPPQNSTLPPQNSTPPHENSTPPPQNSTPVNQVPQDVLKEISELKHKEHDAQKVKRAIRKLCSFKPFKASEIALYLNKREDYIRRKFLGEMIANRELRYLYPEIINHPEQAYLSNQVERWQDNAT